MAFYWLVLRATPLEFLALFDRWWAWFGTAVALLSLLSKPIANWFSMKWEGIAPEIGIAIFLCLFVIAAFRANFAVHKRVEEERNSAIAERDSAIAAREDALAQLKSTETQLRPVLSIKPVTFSENGKFILAVSDGAAFRSSIRLEIRNSGKTIAKDIEFLLPKEINVGNQANAIYIPPLPPNDIPAGDRTLVSFTSMFQKEPAGGEDPLVQGASFSLVVKYRGTIKAQAEYKTTVAYDVSPDKFKLRMNRID